MVTTLTEYGDSYALVIDKPLLDSLGIHPDMPLTISTSTDGKSLVVSPEDEGRSGVSEEFEQSLSKVNDRFAAVLQRLA